MSIYTKLAEASYTNSAHHCVVGLAIITQDVYQTRAAVEQEVKHVVVTFEFESTFIFNKNEGNI